MAASCTLKDCALKDCVLKDCVLKDCAFNIFVRENRFYVRGIDCDTVDVTDKKVLATIRQKIQTYPCLLHHR